MPSSQHSHSKAYYVLKSNTFVHTLSLANLFIGAMPLVFLLLFRFHPTGNNKQQMHQKLIELVQGTAVGKTLSSVSKENCEEMYQRYLSDFVRIVHKCSHKGKEIVSKEYKVRVAFLSCMIDGTACTPPLSILSSAHQ